MADRACWLWASWLRNKFYDVDAYKRKIADFFFMATLTSFTKTTAWSINNSKHQELMVSSSSNVFRIDCFFFLDFSDRFRI